ncbi:MAG: UDP-N-acetylmuramoyl-tripeptide--D-alanyl-D-alanine ligase [Eubacteriales bacterium]|nr:UDP-N-acetylmuramoyl-tripeptide--D-alanyl-D-alanine ligase [Eubacteriales bacterium]
MTIINFAIGIFIIDILQIFRQVHMLQLNSYNFDSHAFYLKKHIKDFIINFFLLLSSLIVLFFNSFNIYLSLICIFQLIFLLIILIENLPRKMIKPLVYTNRVFRLFFTIFIITLLSFVPVFYIIYNREEIALLLKYKSLFLPILFCSIMPLVVQISNYINSPIEKISRNKYIKEAKNKLLSMNNLEVIGITGSYGKTSTKYFLSEILNEKFNVLITPSSFNTPMGIVKAIRENLRSIDEIFICEMGARRVGDIKEICDIVSPTSCIITSIGPQHLDTFKNTQNILSTKFELVDYINSNNKEAKILVNGDNEYIKERINNNIKTFGLNTNNDYYAKNIYTTSEGTSFTFVDKNDNKAISFHTILLGNNNILNLISSIAFSKMLGMNYDDIILSVKRIKPVKHRLELLKENKELSFIDDAYNSNPVGAEEALHVLSLFDTSTKICITPGMVELGEKEDELNRNFAKQMINICDYILLVGEKNTHRIKDEIYKTKFDKEKVHSFSKVQDAIYFARKLQSTKHKCVLLENDLPDNYN